ncbi:D-lactate dehydrogenase [Aspergillus granulosus]|uniref:D-lactate dehydrogenase n=1 Tax=Aspergillus granulosus TaxID=176169 RepID=A0ABR4HV81_9EURO
MTDTLTTLATFASQNPDIHYVDPTSPDFNGLRRIYAHPEIIPSAILRPETEDAVAATVSFLASNRIEFTIRAGGHDMHGRSTKNDTVVLDLRLLNKVHVDPVSSTATVGGGTLIRDVIAATQPKGFVTPTGSISSVGYIGWAMYGGYGAYSAQFGLGVDQIIGAKVVTAAGETVAADAELLKAIRGGGGAFGVITEVTIRVYKVEKILAGIIVFDSADLAGVVRKFNDGYRALSAQGLPAALSLSQAVLNLPTPTFGLLFMWASEEIETGEAWVEKICSLAPVVSRTVKETTPLDWLDEQYKLVAQETRGRLWSLNIRQITDEVAGVIGDFTSRLPADPHTLFNIHELRTGSPSVSAAGKNEHADSSVFNARVPHFLIEICPTVDDEKKLEAGLVWGKEFWEALKATEKGNILAASYVSLLAEEEFDHAAVYGEELEFLRGVKARVDPGNVFRNAISYI